MTCLFAGGPCNTQAKGSLDKYYCTRCSFYEKLDRDYVDYIKKDLTRKLQETIDKKKPLSLLSLDLDDEYILSDGDLNDFMLTNHCYHLSWAVFKHLPSNYPIFRLFLLASNRSGIVYSYKLLFFSLSLTHTCRSKTVQCAQL